MTDTTRKLATIVAVDVAGYSARTEADEARSTTEVAALRTVIEAIAAKHGGRVFNTAGDGFMLEFGSSLAAVEAAFELAEKCEPKVRVGVHAGDVIPQPNGDLLGHGVNVAARLMAQAVPGSVLLSADVKHMMRGPLVQSLRPKGTIKLAKMSTAIEVFAFLPEAPLRQDLRARAKTLWTRIVSQPAQRLVPAVVALLGVAAITVWMLVAIVPPSSPALPTPTATPDASIAVMPFENLSADMANAFFAVGIQDEILTRLTKIGSLKVISRTSTAHLASRPNNLPEIARQLGVATILEGSVQRDGNSVRVNVQLIKAATDTHLWAESYDRKLDNVFSVQSDIAFSIANALSAKVTGEEKQSLTKVPTTNPDAYDAYLRGLAQYHAISASEATRSLTEAVRLDPAFAVAWALLARIEANKYYNYPGIDSLRTSARVAVETALRLQPDLAEAQLAQGYYLYYVERDYEGARRQFDHVRVKWPNESDAMHALGLIARRLGDWEGSRSYFEQAVFLNPLDPNAQGMLIGSLAAERDFASALRRFDIVLDLWPGDVQFSGWKAHYLQVLGRVKEAGAMLTLRPLPSNPSAPIYRIIFDQAVLEKQYSEAIAVLQKLFELKPNNVQSAEIRLNLGRLRGLSGDTKRASADLEQARVLLLTELATTPKNTRVLEQLALTYCYLGQRENALDHIGKAISIVPVSQDSLLGPELEDTRMRIWAHFGDREHAIPEIARLLGVSYYWAITPALLRLDPTFDKLRGDPRFEALANSDIKSK